MFYSLHNYFISYAILFAFVLLILVHYLDIQHPNCSFDFSSVEISGSVDCDQGKEQTTNKRFVSLFFVFCISAIHFYFLFLLSFECFHEQKKYSSPRSESTAQPSTKACREKIRRDKLNERYVPWQKDWFHFNILFNLLFSVSLLYLLTIIVTFVLMVFFLLDS